MARESTGNIVRDISEGRGKYDFTKGKSKAEKEFHRKISRGRSGGQTRATPDHQRPRRRSKPSPTYKSELLEQTFKSKTARQKAEQTFKQEQKKQREERQREQEERGQRIQSGKISGQFSSARQQENPFEQARRRASMSEQERSREITQQVGQRIRSFGGSSGGGLAGSAFPAQIPQISKEELEDLPQAGARIVTTEEREQMRRSGSTTPVLDISGTPREGTRQITNILESGGVFGQAGGRVQIPFIDRQLRRGQETFEAQQTQADIAKERGRKLGELKQEIAGMSLEEFQSKPEQFKVEERKLKDETVYDITPTEDFLKSRIDIGPTKRKDIISDVRSEFQTLPTGSRMLASQTSEIEGGLQLGESVVEGTVNLLAAAGTKQLKSKEDLTLNPLKEGSFKIDSQLDRLPARPKAEKFTEDPLAATSEFFGPRTTAKTVLAGSALQVGTVQYGKFRAAGGSRAEFFGGLSPFRPKSGVYSVNLADDEAIQALSVKNVKGKDFSRQIVGMGKDEPFIVSSRQIGKIGKGGKLSVAKTDTNIIQEGIYLGGGQFREGLTFSGSEGVQFGQAGIIKSGRFVGDIKTLSELQGLTGGGSISGTRPTFSTFLETSTRPGALAFGKITAGTPYKIQGFGGISKGKGPVSAFGSGKARPQDYFKATGQKFYEVGIKQGKFGFTPTTRGFELDVSKLGGGSDKGFSVIKSGGRGGVSGGVSTTQATQQALSGQLGSIQTSLSQATTPTVTQTTGTTVAGGTSLITGQKSGVASGTTTKRGPGQRTIQRPSVTRDIVKETQKPVLDILQSSGSRTQQDLRSGLGLRPKGKLTERERVIQRQPQDTRQITRQRQDFKLRQDLRVPTPVPPPTITIPGFGFPGFPGGVPPFSPLSPKPILGKGKKKKSKTARQPSLYQPSFTAAAFKIRGKSQQLSKRAGYNPFQVRGLENGKKRKVTKKSKIMSKKGKKRKKPIKIL